MFHLHTQTSWNPSKFCFHPFSSLLSNDIRIQHWGCPLDNFLEMVYHSHYSSSYFPRKQFSCHNVLQPLSVVVTLVWARDAALHMVQLSSGTTPRNAQRNFLSVLYWLWCWTSQYTITFSILPFRFWNFHWHAFSIRAMNRSNCS